MRMTVRWLKFAICDRTRACVLFTLSFGLVVSGVVRAQSEFERNVSRNRALEVEHRMSTVETRVDTLSKEISELGDKIENLTKLDWVKILALAGLMGEAGVRTIRKSKS